MYLRICAYYVVTYYVYLICDVCMRVYRMHSRTPLHPLTRSLSTALTAARYLATLDLPYPVPRYVPRYEGMYPPPEGMLSIPWAQGMVECTLIIHENKTINSLI